MGESRTDLIGAAYCQIMDSIFADVHMSKVKFDPKHEYEHVGNFKVRQHTFESTIDKCKFQDNLEFMQWIKRFWDQNYPGGSYDALAQHKGGSPGASGTAAAKPANGSLGGRGASSSPARKHTSAARPSSRSAGTPRNGVGENGSSAVVIELDKQISDLKLTVDGLEKEREFYFGKLRDIEILIQDAMDRNEGRAPPTAFKEIQNVLYSTEGGFEAPLDEVGAAGDLAGHHQDDFDDETF